MKPKIYFIADTHFYDDSIIMYEKRPFKNVKEMNQELVKNWNETVNKKDLIFILGDFIFNGEEDYNRLVRQALSQLNGKKILIMGNHDTLTEKEYIELGFDSAYQYPILYNEFLILSHEPLYMNTQSPYVNIFGHVHGNPTFKDCSSNSFCVSVERIKYKPIELGEIIDRLKIEKLILRRNEL